MKVTVLVILVYIQNICGNIIISTFDNKEECEEINSESTNIKCQVCENIVDCLYDIDSGNTTFGLIYHEDAIISASFLENTVVAAEIRNTLRYKDRYEEDFVIVGKNFSSTNLENAKYCHVNNNDPFYKYCSSIFLNYILSNLEDYYPKPTDEYSIKEHGLKILNSFFGESCIPDAKLLELPNLCTSCTYPQSCNYSTNERNETLNCLNKGGNIAITPKSLCSNIPSARYMCIDNSVSSNPCTWCSKSWPLIITNRNNFQKTTTFLNDMFVKLTQENIDQRPYVRVLLFPKVTDEISFMKTQVTLDDYIGATHKIIQKNHTLRWCMTSELEVNKCRWINKAAHFGGIPLNITCIMFETRDDCIHSVRTDSTDMFVMSKRFSSLFRNDIQGITSIAYIKNATPLKSLILVKDETVQSLEGKSGCFSGYQDEAYLSFLAHRKDYDLGFHKQLEKLNASMGDPIMCNSNICNIYSKNKQSIEDTLFCLEENDFAVVIENETILSKRNNVFVLCKNNVKSYSTDLPSDCYLSKIFDQFIIRKNYRYKIDVLELLTFIENMDRFKLFKPFAKKSHVLFQDNSSIIFKKPGDRNDPLSITQLAKTARLHAATLPSNRVASNKSAYKASHNICFVCIFIFTIIKSHVILFLFNL